MSVRLMGKENKLIIPMSLREAINVYFYPNIINPKIKFNNPNDILFDDFEQQLEEYNANIQKKNNEN